MCGWSYDYTVTLNLFYFVSRQSVFSFFIKGSGNNTNNDAKNRHNYEPDNIPNKSKSSQESESRNIYTRCCVIGHMDIFIGGFWYALLLHFPVGITRRNLWHNSKVVKWCW